MKSIKQDRCLRFIEMLRNGVKSFVECPFQQHVQKCSVDRNISLFHLSKVFQYMFLF